MDALNAETRIEGTEIFSAAPDVGFRREALVATSGEVIGGAHAQFDSFFGAHCPRPRRDTPACFPLHHVPGEVIDEVHPAAKYHAGAVVHGRSGAVQHPLEVFIRGVGNVAGGFGAAPGHTVKVDV